jgi:molybdate/tungstate transport system substrate-binding protein
MNRIRIAAAVLIAVIAMGAAQVFLNRLQEPETGSQRLKVFCAGSLLYPLNKVADAFMEDHPGIEVEVEGHGSIQVIRNPTELDDPADLLMVADCSLIPVMMYKTPIPGGEGNFTDWYIRFAGNRLVLAYTDQSRYSDEVNTTNWFEVLSRGDVKIALANPIIDALGYRGLLVLQLAEYHYGDRQIFERILGPRFNPEIETVEVGSRTVIFVPEQFKPLEDKVAIRASSIQIVPLLESGAVDYTFLYLSNAEQYGVKYVELPPEIDLGSPEMDELYMRAQVRFQHARFQSIGLDRKGRTIYYGLTIPGNAANPEDAVEFTKYLLVDRGREIFEENSHPIYQPSYTDNLNGVPEELRSLVIQEQGTG